MTGKPIKFVSMGEKPDSLEPFYPDRMAKRILGMGDVVGIIEKAQEAADAEQLEAAERMLREGFTMNDMLDQMKAVKKMGGMKGILGMLPGGQRALNQMGGNLDEGIFDKNEAIIMSMTKEERLRPSIINGQRRARIAKGAGVTPTEVNSLMKQWGEMNKMMGRHAHDGQSGTGRRQEGQEGQEGQEDAHAQYPWPGRYGSGRHGRPGYGRSQVRYGVAAPDGSADAQ